MTTEQSVITIFAVAAGTVLTRFLPFLIFPRGRLRRNILLVWEERCPMRSLGFW